MAILRGLRATICATKVRVTAMDHSQRNASIVKDKQSGMTLKEIAQKYGISCARAGQICSNKKREYVTDTALWQRLCDAAKTIGGYDQGQIMRTYNIIKRGHAVIRREGGSVYIEHTPFEQLPREQWAQLRNCGAKTLKLLYAAFPDGLQS